MALNDPGLQRAQLTSFVGVQVVEAKAPAAQEEQDEHGETPLELKVRPATHGVPTAMHARPTGSHEKPALQLQFVCPRRVEDALLLAPHAEQTSAPACAKKLAAQGWHTPATGGLPAGHVAQTVLLVGEHGMLTTEVLAQVLQLLQGARPEAEKLEPLAHWMAAHDVPFQAAKRGLHEQPVWPASVPVA